MLFCVNLLLSLTAQLALAHATGFVLVPLIDMPMVPLLVLMLVSESVLFTRTVCHFYVFHVICKYFICVISNIISIPPSLTLGKICLNSFHLGCMN